MKALFLVDHPEDKLQIKETTQPSPSEGQVLVRIKAAALNRRDQWIRQGMYPGIQFETILGSDGAGVVEAVGAGVDESWIGKEVILNPNMNWGDNPAVQAVDYHILGMPTHGTFAEYLVVNKRQLFEKPAHLSFEQAAALPLGGLTAYRSVFHHGQVGEGKTVLISGMGGGVAQFAFQFALAAGARVYVTSGQDSKLEKAKEMGAAGGFNYKSEGWQKEAIKASGGYDCVIDSAGGDQLNDFIKMMRPAGRIVFYGATNGMPSKLDVFRMFWNQITIQGSTMGNDQEFEEMIQWTVKYGITPVIDKTFDVEDYLSAFNRFKEPDHFGKIVLKW